MKYLTLFLLLITLPGLSQPSKIDHTVFSQNDGLELDRILAMEFDNDGFLWLGGTNQDVRKIILNDKELALQRFNGSTFHTIPLPAVQPPLNVVSHIYKREDGLFYVVAQSDEEHLFLFDPLSLEFSEIEMGDANKGLVSCSNVFRYKENNYLLTQEASTITLNILTEDAVLVPQFSFQNKEHRFLLESSTKFIPFEDFCLIGDDNFPLTLLDWEGKVLKEFKPETFKKDRGSNVSKFWLKEIFTYGNKQYTFPYQSQQLHSINIDSQTIRPENEFVSEDENINTIQDAQGDHLIVSVSDDGIISFHEASENGLKLKYRAAAFDGNPAVKLISQDLKKDLWIGTTSNELHHFKFPSEKIRNFLMGSSIRAIHHLDGPDYLIATEADGWYKINTETQEQLPFPLKEDNKLFMPNSARNMIPKGDSLWSNHGGSVIRVNITTGESISFKHFPILCLERFNDSLLVYGTKGYKLMSFNTRTKTHRELASTDSLEVYDISVSVNKEFIIGGTDRGLLVFNANTSDASLLKSSSGFTDEFILMVDRVKDSEFLLGTRSGKLIRFDATSQTFETVYEDPLKAGIATVTSDEDNYWINTFNGLVVYDTISKTSVRYSKKDGLSDNEANRYSALKRGDEMLLGTINGLNYFRPSELKPRKIEANLVLLKVRNYDGELGIIVDNFNRLTLDNDEGIVLTAENKSFEIDYSITHNINAVPIAYRYRLDNDPWTDLGTQSSLRFANFATGRFKLEIEALDFSGNKIGESLVIPIISKDFFYKTWWFYLLVLLLASVLFFYLLKQASLKGRLQQRFSEALMFSQEQERTRIAGELHDSVGQQLTLIKKKAQNADQDEISALTHNALEEVRGISRGLYPAVLKQLGLTESIEQLIYDLDEETDMFFSSDIDNIDDLLNEKKALNFYRFMQESFNNIVKHSKATAVDVIVKRNPKGFTARIEDNGIGFSVSEKEKQNSLGLKTLSERIRILGGTLTLESAPGGGTQIIADIK
ncbi:MAG: hypothetical protein DWP94_14910 [Flavobacterium sp.]|nr:MAG: hypothetical protein DWP94_14910 [Flavobacterium sp.]